MTVSERARARGVTELLHYTSERGMRGIVMKGGLLSRTQVELDGDLEYTYEGVWERKDPEWIDHISLSVSRINLDLYERSRKRFPEWWWAIVSLDVALLDHPGVWFTTTNNVYDVCKRGQGVAGFEAIFGSPIAWRWYGYTHVRRPGHPCSWPTDRAAEVLYPTRIAADFVQAVYVPGRQHRRMINAWSDAFGRSELSVDVDVRPFF